MNNCVSVCKGSCRARAWEREEVLFRKNPGHLSHGWLGRSLQEELWKSFVSFILELSRIHTTPTELTSHPRPCLRGNKHSTRIIFQFSCKWLSTESERKRCKVSPLRKIYFPSCDRNTIRSGWQSGKSHHLPRGFKRIRRMGKKWAKERARKRGSLWPMVFNPLDPLFLLMCSCLLSPHFAILLLVFFSLFSRAKSPYHNASILHGILSSGMLIALWRTEI